MWMLVQQLRFSGGIGLMKSLVKVFSSRIGKFRKTQNR